MSKFVCQNGCTLKIEQLEAQIEAVKALPDKWAVSDESDEGCKYDGFGCAKQLRAALKEEG